MRFEDAIKAMRMGQSCRRDNRAGWVFYFLNNRLVFDSPSLKAEECSDLQSHLEADWYIIEPPMPLPRRFRAEYLGEEVTGAVLDNGNHFWCGKQGGSFRARASGDSRLSRLQNIKLIDPPCTD